jgi:alpha-beta hydrolase superfamily lysophospholipase
VTTTADALEVQMPDGVILRGLQWRGGEDAVVLLHDVGQDLDSWAPISSAVAAAGFTVMAIDLRGHGASDGAWDPARLSEDLRAILGAARASVRGRLVLIGAGSTGPAVFAAGIEPRPDAVILFSPGPLADPLGAWELRGEGISKLFIVGSRDQVADRTAVELRNRSIGIASLVSVSSNAHGAALLGPEWQQQLVEKVLAFLSEIRSVSQEAGT